MRKTPTIIAVDGLSGSGKTSISKAIAKHYGYEYLDTGSVYRAVTLLALKNGLNVDSFDESNKDTYAPLLRELKKANFSFTYNPETDTAIAKINDTDVTKELKTPLVSNLVAKVSKIEDVRVWVRGFQYKYAEGKDIVMEGRDITTVVFPNAKIKLFVTTDIDVRAERRAKDYERLGKFVSIETVKKDIEARDHLDIFRKHSPLKITTDAYVLDTSYKTIDETIAEAISHIEEKLQNSKKD